MVRKKALAAKEAVKTEEVSAEAVKEAASAKKEAEAAESEKKGRCEEDREESRDENQPFGTVHGKGYF